MKYLIELSTGDRKSSTDTRIRVGVQNGAEVLDGVLTKLSGVLDR